MKMPARYLLTLLSVGLSVSAIACGSSQNTQAPQTTAPAPTQPAATETPATAAAPADTGPPIAGTYSGGGFTINVNGSGANASYNGCDTKNQCLTITEPSSYDNGVYVWKNGDYSYSMTPVAGGSYILKVTDPSDSLLVNTQVNPVAANTGQPSQPQNNNPPPQQQASQPTSSAQTYAGGGFTVTINGTGYDASYRGCDKNNDCLSIAAPSDYQEGVYVWENGNYSYIMEPNGNNIYTLRVLDPNNSELVNTQMSPTR